MIVRSLIFLFFVCCHQKTIDKFNSRFMTPMIPNGQLAITVQGQIARWTYWNKTQLVALPFGKPISHFNQPQGLHVMSNIKVSQPFTIWQTAKRAKFELCVTYYQPGQLTNASVAFQINEATIMRLNYNLTQTGMFLKCTIMYLQTKFYDLVIWGQGFQGFQIDGYKIEAVLISRNFKQPTKKNGNHSHQQGNDGQHQRHQATLV